MALNASRVRYEFADLLSRVGYRKERLLIKRHGKPVAALVPVEDLTLLEKLEDRLDLDAAREALKEPGAIPWKQLKASLFFSGSTGFRVGAGAGGRGCPSRVNPDEP